MAKNEWQGLGCGLDVIGCGTGIAIRADRSLSHSILRDRLGSGIDNRRWLCMICAYCGKEAKGTKEHIISSGILGLFPECFATIDGERSIVHQGEPMVKDVCADCNNNRISYIDSYAKEFIEKYFLVKYKKDDTLSVEYDYTMIQ